MSCGWDCNGSLTFPEFSRTTRMRGMAHSSSMDAWNDASARIALERAEAPATERASKRLQVSVAEHVWSARVFAHLRAGRVAEELVTLDPARDGHIVCLVIGVGDRRKARPGGTDEEPPAGPAHTYVKRAHHRVSRGRGTVRPGCAHHVRGEENREEGHYQPHPRPQVHPEELVRLGAPIQFSSF